MKLKRVEYWTYKNKYIQNIIHKHKNNSWICSNKNLSFPKQMKVYFNQLCIYITVQTFLLKFPFPVPTPSVKHFLHLVFPRPLYIIHGFIIHELTVLLIFYLTEIKYQSVTSNYKVKWKDINCFPRLFREKTQIRVWAHQLQAWSPCLLTTWMFSL